MAAAHGLPGGLPALASSAAEGAAALSSLASSFMGGLLTQPSRDVTPATISVSALSSSAAQPVVRSQLILLARWCSIHLQMAWDQVVDIFFMHNALTLWSFT